MLAWSLDPEIPDLHAINQCIEQASTPDSLEHRLRDLTYRFPQTADRAARLLWTTYVDGFAAFG